MLVAQTAQLPFWAWITEPLTLEFMRNALIAGAIAGVICPAIGCFLIVQRMSLLGDVMTHTVMPGMAIAFFWRIDVAIGAFAVSLYTSDAASESRGVGLGGRLVITITQIDKSY